MNRNLIKELQDVLLELFKDHNSNNIRDRKELNITIRVKDLDVVNNGFSKALCETNNIIGIDSIEPVYYTGCTIPGVITIKINKDDK